MYVCVGQARPGIQSQLNGTVWMLLQLLKAKNHSQAHGGHPTRRSIALRGSEHIIYKRWDNESDFETNDPCSVLGLGGGREECNCKEWGIRAGE